MLIPAYAKLGAGLLVVAGAFTMGWRVSSWRHDSMELAVQQAAQKAGQAATEAAVATIKGLRPQFTTINRAVEREFRNEVRFASADCSHTPESWRLLDSAYQAAGGEPFDSGTGLPTSAPSP